MSRRPPNSNLEKAAQNQQTLKTLVKLESNKTCADCKRNKHPRWASWNIGVFLCIRCSGIHRGMGTHISRVKSVDLDAWTDEQMQNMLKWGNARANKYWEAKLAVGHVPSEGKIENFIRTKYDSKRWVMDGGMPDPSTLDTDEDDETPLNVVQEKAKLGHTARNPSTNTPPPQANNSNPDIDLFGDNVGPPPAPKSNANLMGSSNPPPTPPKTDPVVAKPAKTGESLLGFDFFGEPQVSVPARPSSAASSITSTNAPSRPDLKQSILSLYSSNPRTSSPNHQQQPVNTMQAKSPPPQANFGNLESDFNSLNFGAASSTSRPSSTQQSSSFAAPPPPKISPAPQQLSGGSFFDAKPPSTTISASGTPGAGVPPVFQRGMSASSGFGDFATATSPGFNNSSQPKSNALGDMFDFSGPSPVSEKPPATVSAATTQDSPFNISSPSPQPHLPKSEAKPAPMATSAALMNMDPWGSNDAWSSSASTHAMPAAPPPKASATISPPADEWGWGGAAGGDSSTSGGFDSSSGQATQITADEDFSGWASSTIASPTQPSKPANFSSQSPTPPPKPAGGFSTAGDDLFSNVWE